MGNSCQQPDLLAGSWHKIFPRPLRSGTRPARGAPGSGWWSARAPRPGTEARRFNQNAIAAFYSNLHNLIDYRHTWAPRAPEANRELLALCDSIFELERRFESEPENRAISDLADELRRLGALTAEFSSATAEAIGDLVAALESLGSYGGSNGDLPSLGGFAALFGRGQQYLSFIRR